jgi:hypothetical protein
LAGRERVGAVVSLTVTVKLAEPVLLELSVALHVTVVSPKSNKDPDAGEHVGVRVPSTLSFAVADP